MKRMSKKEGFTLIELMIVVVIIGVLAALAIPTFIDFVKRSKTSEVPDNLKALFVGATTYYNQERYERGTAAGDPNTNCTVAAAAASYTAGNSKQVIDWDGEADSYELLGFGPADPVYYEYHIEGSTDLCGILADTDVYTFTANGDLDGDGVQSTFELAVTSNASNELRRAPGIFSDNELE